MKKSDTLRGHGIFRSVARGGRRLDGKFLRAYARVSRGQKPAWVAGVTVYDRSLTAVERNLVRRRLRAAFDREQTKLAETARASGLRVEVVFGYRPQSGGRVPRFAELHADLAALLEAMINRIRQQWPQQ